MRKAGVIWLSLGFLGWSLIVIASAKGVNFTDTPWNFTNTAQLGDSFGIFSSLMASIAAYYAFATYQSAKEEAKIAGRRAAEPSYLNLLERRFDVLDRIDAIRFMWSGNNYDRVETKGQSAIDFIASELIKEISKHDEPEEKGMAYWDFINAKVRGLTNYHRFVFHIIDFAQRQFSEVAHTDAMIKTDPAYEYIKILRAQFSDSEMKLLAMNALYGNGFPKMKMFIERYALLNNMPMEDILELGIENEFETTAFGILAEDRHELFH